MPPKNSSGKEKEVAHDDDDILQAVILADSFNERFKPLTLNKPRVCQAMNSVVVSVSYISNELVSFTNV